MGQGEGQAHGYGLWITWSKDKVGWVTKRHSNKEPNPSEIGGLSITNHLPTHSHTFPLLPSLLQPAARKEPARVKYDPIFPIIHVRIRHSALTFTNSFGGIGLGFPFVHESANKKVRTRTNESTNCSFADGDKSANNEHCLHFFKKVKVRTRCTFYKHIENSFFEGWEFLFHDWICANISLLCHLSDWLVGSVQIHCRTGPAACPTAVLSHLESGGRISAEHSADICRFLLSP